MKILHVVGARPQFIKAAPVCKALRRAGHTEFILHTGQHYDVNMSQVFFEEMGIPRPDANLNIGSGNHGWQTGQMLLGIENILLDENPDWVLVYGDTNSTLAGALAAVKLHIPVAHVEAGLRSFNRDMPEEHNRVLTDHCSDLNFCPTRTAVIHLEREGITQGVHQVGDVMYDAVLQFSEVAVRKSKILTKLGVERKSYYLATVHRPNNTDHPGNLKNILEAFGELLTTVVFPVHPRTRRMITPLYKGENLPKNIMLVEPVGYLDMLVLEKNAKTILTDSGGIQKEAYFFAVPCVTLRPETEWIETVEAGWNVLAGCDKETIVAAVNNASWSAEIQEKIFGSGNAAEIISSHFCD